MRANWIRPIGSVGPFGDEACMRLDPCELWMMNPRRLSKHRVGAVATKGCQTALKGILAASPAIGWKVNPGN